MHKIKEMLMDELYEYEEKAKKMSGGKISASDLDTIHKLTDTVKNIDKIEMLEDEGGYSEGGEWMGEGKMYGSYESGESYARGRGRNARRDSMGRYSRERGYSDEGGSYRGGSSYEGRGGERGYSRGGAKGHMIRKLEMMMEDANSEKEREAIRHCIEKIENA